MNTLRRSAALTPAARSGPTVVWFRRDLRLHDHPALLGALALGAPVAPLVVLDRALLRSRFASPNRTWFLIESVRALAGELVARGAALTVRVGRPEDAVPAFADEIGAAAVWVTRDLAPYGRRRDERVADRLAAAGIAWRASPGLVVHEPEAVLAGDGGRPYRVFGPYLRRWTALEPRPVLAAPAEIPAIPGGDPIPSAADLGLPPPTADVAAMPEPGEPAARRRLEAWLAAGPARGPEAYAGTRDDLGIEDGTSRLSQDLRFGLLSPVEVATRVLALGDGRGPRGYLAELAWRDFYAHLLWHEPRLAHEPFDRRHAGVDWPGGNLGDPRTEAPDGAVVAWRTGRTGYPVVDAAMRQLAATGFMPNRARMIVASFLAKDLLVDWRVGEAHFMAHLLDGDPASNLGGWQWTASVGTDAQPYFRVLNPVLQGRRHDPDGTYVRRWVPELRRVPDRRIHEPWTMTATEQGEARCRIGADYPAPIVDHAEARRRALAWFASVRERPAAGTG